MSSLYFYVGVVLIIIIVTIIISITENRKKRVIVKQLWEQNAKWLEYNETFINFDHFYRNLIADGNVSREFEVDDVTWHDLDMDSLFKEINHTFTTVGEERLYAALRNVGACEDVDENFIARLNTDQPWREKITWILSKLSKQPNSDTSKYFTHYTPSGSVRYQPLYAFLSVLPVVGIGMLLINFLLGILVIIGALLLNMVISYQHKSKYENEYSDLFYGLNIISVATQLKPHFHDMLNTSVNIEDGVKHLQLFSTLLINEEADQNNILLQLLTGVKHAFILDYHVCHYIINTLVKNKDTYEKCWHLVSTADLNYSVAMWRRQLPYYVTPNAVQDESMVIHDVYHPLITEPISNSIDLRQNILLTGSNASGKSTFMKSLAVNVILSNGINTSTSGYFKYVPGRVLSSMDISDSISEGDSYFISEIKSLKRIIEALNGSNAHFYCFIDEIFKGTNTKERLAAAEVLLRFLSTHRRISLVAATHDIELTETLCDEMVMYHFSEVLEGDDIFFDYQIKKGPAQTSNALELLRIFNFPKSIYKASKRLLEEHY